MGQKHYEKKGDMGCNVLYIHCSNYKNLKYMYITFLELTILNGTFQLQLKCFSQRVI